MVRRSFVACIAVALTLGAMPAGGMPLESQGECGVWRWSVKTLSDPDRTDVNFDPQLTTVQSLRTRDDQPADLHTDTPRIWPVEKKTYTVKARVISAKVEDDSDIHLVISQRNATSRTMIVEFPAPTCVASAFKRPAMAAARNAMLSNCGGISSTHFTELTGNVEVTGVGFWDQLHNQTGVAPNGIELHPGAPVHRRLRRRNGAGGPGVLTRLPGLLHPATPARPELRRRGPAYELHRAAARPSRVRWERQRDRLRDVTMDKMSAPAASNRRRGPLGPMRSRSARAKVRDGMYDGWARYTPVRPASGRRVKISG